MNTFASPVRRLSLAVSCLLAAGASVSFGSDLVLHKVPSSAPLQQDAMSFGLVNYNLSDPAAKPRVVYVSSGADVMQAANMVDQQNTTSYTFAKDDTAPTAVIDLGKSQSVRQVAATFGAHKGNMSIYILNSLPESSANAAPADMPNIVKVSSDALAAMKPVASVEDEGSLGEATANFAATSGRYVMVRWNGAVKQDGGFTVAEVAAYGGNEDQTVAKKQTNKHRYNDVSDSKEMVDSKDMADSKDIPAEGPQGEEAPPPGEGPPPGLPPPPPFTFIPQIVPASP